MIHRSDFLLHRGGASKAMRYVDQHIARPVFQDVIKPLAQAPIELVREGVHDAESIRKLFTSPVALIGAGVLIVLLMKR